MSKCFVAPGTGGVEASANAQQTTAQNSAGLVSQAAATATANQPMAQQTLNSEMPTAQYLSNYLSGGYASPTVAGPPSSGWNGVGDPPLTMAPVGSPTTVANPLYVAPAAQLQTPTSLSSFASKLPTVPTAANLPASYTPSAATLSALSQTPDWQTAGAEVRKAYGDTANVATAQNLNAGQQALAASMAQRGLTGSSINNSGMVGLQNLASIQGAQANAQGLVASQAEEQSLRNEGATNAVTASNLQQTAAEDAISQAQAQQALNASLRGEQTGQVQQDAQWAAQDSQNANNTTIAQSQLNTAQQQQQSSNYMASLQALTGISNQYATASNLIPVINANNSVAGVYNQAGQSYSQMGQGFNQAIGAVGNLGGSLLDYYGQINSQP
jgi:hypothetical protein